MKYLVVTALALTSLVGSSAACNSDRPELIGSADNVEQGAKITTPNNETKMKIKIGSKTFNATLFDNATAAAFRALLPLTLDMEELNANEKKFDLADPLPTNAANPKTISSGDLMLWQNNTVVLFYKSFSTSYSYTKLGRIEDATGLEAAVGRGNVSVTFELDRSSKE